MICWAQCGGRYADIVMAHDGRLEKSVEVHSAWGTFEWLVEDAFRMGYRVGIVGNSDGHKGRPGASYPGAGWFGAGFGCDETSSPATTATATPNPRTAAAIRFMPGSEQRRCLRLQKDLRRSVGA